MSNPVLVTRAYLDTCIVSGLAKGDLPRHEESALMRILAARKAGQIELLTSSVTATEIGQIPEQYRRPHSIVYVLIADVPQAITHATSSSLMLLGVGGGRREDPLFTQLRTALPDVADAEHTFQAAKNGVDYLVTVDRHSFIKHASAVDAICGVKLVTPSELEKAVGLGNAT